jgi:hypothetical protein
MHGMSNIKLVFQVKASTFEQKVEDKKKLTEDEMNKMYSKVASAFLFGKPKVYQVEQPGVYGRIILKCKLNE